MRGGDRTGVGGEPEEEGAEDEDDGDGVDGVLGEPRARRLLPPRVGSGIVGGELI